MVSLVQLEDTEAIKEIELISAIQATDLSFYVAASVNYDDFYPAFTIGDGSNSVDPISRRFFYNIPLQKQQTYYYFVRAYSTAHTTEVSHG